MAKRSAVQNCQQLMMILYGNFYMFCQEEQNIILLCFAINYTAAETKELNMRLEVDSDSSLFEIRLLLAKVLSILDSTFRVCNLDWKIPIHLQ